jgi:YesN/AraC family two-component response regulator
MYSVVLVDDEKWVRTALKWTIQKTGLPLAVTHECSNGLEALDWLRGNTTDLVMTDIRMPVMDGMTLVREIRKRCADAQDIIIISVHDDFAFVQQALREGVRDYLLKPVEANDLSDCLQKWMKRRQKETRAVEPEPEPAGLSPVKKVIRYIETTSPGQITLAEAAKRVHMNACYLSQLFKQEMDMNFMDYVTDLRIREAKRLLTNTSLRVSEIADRLGYADIAYFSNLFKKHTGSTPSEYRAAGKRN